MSNGSLERLRVHDTGAAELVAEQVIPEGRKFVGIRRITTEDDEYAIYTAYQELTCDRPLILVCDDAGDVRFVDSEGAVGCSS